MGEYRAYTVGSDGHFIDYKLLTCADDAEAIEKATRLVEGYDMEGRQVRHAPEHKA